MAIICDREGPVLLTLEEAHDFIRLRGEGTARLGEPPACEEGQGDEGSGDEFEMKATTSRANRGLRWFKLSVFFNL